jgi:hypothetical protein
LKVCCICAHGTHSKLVSPENLFEAVGQVDQATSWQTCGRRIAAGMKRRKLLVWKKCAYGISVITFNETK